MRERKRSTERESPGWTLIGKLRMEKLSWASITGFISAVFGFSHAVKPSRHTSYITLINHEVSTGFSRVDSVLLTATSNTMQPSKK